MTRLRQFLILLPLLISVSGRTSAAADWFESVSDWHGFPRYHFKVAERKAYIVAPKTVAEDQPWIWRARFPDFHFEMDVELLKQGFHVAYVDVAGLFGSPKAMQIGESFYDFVTTERGLAKQPVMEGVSRGGLFVYNWTALHPDRVKCIYCDTPVLDFKSWPGGKGSGIGSAGTWKQCLEAYGFTEDEALSFNGNPLDHAAIVAKHKIPVMHIVSETDTVVPPKENTYVLQQRLRELGHRMEVISVPMGTEKSHGHHFTHPDPDRVVRFVMQQHASVEPAVSAAATKQFLLCDEILTFEEKDAVPAKSHLFVKSDKLGKDTPKDWTSPIDYRNGSVHIRLEVLEKPPGDIPTTWSLCYIPNKGQKNNYGCTGTPTYTKPGVYEKEVRMTDFWENDSIIWSEGIRQMSLVIKDARKGGQGHAHKQPDLSEFFPTKVRVTMVQIAAGATYDASIIAVSADNIP